MRDGPAAGPSPSPGPSGGSGGGSDKRATRRTSSANRTLASTSLAEQVRTLLWKIRVKRRGQQGQQEQRWGAAAASSDPQCGGDDAAGGSGSRCRDRLSNPRAQETQADADPDTSADAKADAEAAVCAICLEVVESPATLSGCEVPRGGTASTPTRRGHTFCLWCIQQWSAVTNRCPLCKLPFDAIHPDHGGVPRCRQGFEPRLQCPGFRVSDVGTRGQELEGRVKGLRGEGKGLVAGGQRLEVRYVGQGVRVHRLIQIPSTLCPYTLKP